MLRFLPGFCALSPHPAVDFETVPQPFFYRQKIYNRLISATVFEPFSCDMQQSYFAYICSIELVL